MSEPEKENKTENAVKTEPMAVDKGEDTKEENEPSRLMKGKAHFYFNVNHSLRIVILRPVTDKVITHPNFMSCLQTAHSYHVGKTTDGTVEAVLYYRTITDGDDAFITLKKCLLDGGNEECQVSHPNFMLSLSAGQYWVQLTKLSSIAKAPLSESEMKLESQFNRQVIVENLPEISQAELYEKFPDAGSILIYPHAHNLQGVAMLEFKNNEEVHAFLRSTKGKTDINGNTVLLRNYNVRLMQWKNQKPISLKRTQSKQNMNTDTVLSDDERLELCQKVQDCENLYLNVINRTDICGVDKIAELINVHDIQMQPMRDSLKSDTNRRRMEQMDFPEPPEMQTAYTKFSQTEFWLKKFKKAKQIQREEKLKIFDEPKPMSARGGGGGRRGGLRPYDRRLQNFRAGQDLRKLEQDMFDVGQVGGAGFGRGGAGYGRGQGYGRGAAYGYQNFDESYGHQDYHSSGGYEGGQGFDFSSSRSYTGGSFQAENQLTKAVEGLTAALAEMRGGGPGIGGFSGRGIGGGYPQRGAFAMGGQHRPGRGGAWF